jgi:D-alanyl-D-alanine carboxypeptidase (penicillin-binding protein 5/6)
MGRENLRLATRALWVAVFFSAGIAAGTASAADRSAGNPYVGAIVVDADSGDVLYADRADTSAYPASVVKLMNFLLVLEDLEAGRLSLNDEVHVTAEAARMGGSQVYLAENEIFTVEDLLYALMIQSANDAAVALAIHVSGSRPAFVERMNDRAKSLGMKSTRFTSPHGLPPSRGQSPDITTARDIAILAREVVARSEALRYTSTHVHKIRDGKFIMRSHNKLLDMVDGCDGLKTGYYWKAGFSVAATAERDGLRVIAVVLGSESSRTRDREAAKLLGRGFELLPEPVEAAERDAVGPFLEFDPYPR